MIRGRGVQTDPVQSEMYRLPLFKQYPELEEALPRLSLGDYPTPVQRLSRLGHDNLWIKRDDLTSGVYGGNKVRKLEFVLADALRSGAKRIITMGGIGTNHGLATAVFSREAGIPCRLLLFHQPVNECVKRNMLLFRKYGAELVYLKGVLRTGASLMVTQRLLNPRAYILDAGGSSPTGTVGIVNAMFELREQIDAGLLPEPRFIFCPLGSNGTMAGLSLGALLAGITSTVVGVRVTMESVGPVAIATPKTVARLMRKTYALLKKHSSRIPDIDIGPQEVLQGYVGEGYGCVTGECLDAMELVREKEGLELDPAYTSKTFAALLDFIKNPEHAEEPILYWHTYNSADLSERVRPSDCRELPPALRRIYETEMEQEA